MITFFGRVTIFSFVTFFPLFLVRGMDIHFEMIYFDYCGGQGPRNTNQPGLRIRLEKNKDPDPTKKLNTTRKNVGFTQG